MQSLRLRFRRTTLQLIGCLALLVGLGWAHTGHPLSLVWGLVGLPFVVLSWHTRDVRALVAIISCGFLLGWWHGAVYMDKLKVYQPLYFRKVTLYAQANNDAVYGQRAQLSFDAGKVQLASGERLSGKLELAGFGPTAVYQGDAVHTTGKLYPALGGYQGRISFARIQVESHHFSLVAQVRRRFTAGMQSSLPEPLAPFAMGLLIGQRATLPATVKQELLMVGLTHIIAVSGYNLTIMLGASKRLLGNHSKRLSAGLSLGLMALFLLLAGASASIVRAAIVSLLSIAAAYYGRQVRPLNLIAWAAAITAWANPFYLWSDASWYLSFLAFFGVLVLSPLLALRLPARCRDSVPVVVALESLCAETMTLPFVLHTFGQMSFIGLPANVFVVTLVPLAMLLSLFAGLGGMLAGPVSGWIAWPARLLLTYMLDVAHLLAGLPGIFVQHIGFTASQMIAMYLVVIGVVILLAKRGRRSLETKPASVLEK